MSARDVIVTGYPKSGNTWLSRLVAELLALPAGAFVGDGESEILPVDCASSTDDPCVRKSHYTVRELAQHLNPGRVIYVVRDPRDVAVSASHNFRKRFRVVPDNRMGDVMMRLPFLESVYDSLFGKRIRIQRMIHVLQHGRFDMRWCRVPWDVHVRDSLESDCVVVRYEDMLSDPFQQCERILSHLGETRSKEHIEGAIHNQSFDVVKSRAQADGDASAEAFLRRGTGGQWRKRLTAHQKAVLSQSFADVLTRLGYDRS